MNAKLLECVEIAEQSGQSEGHLIAGFVRDMVRNMAEDECDTELISATMDEIIGFANAVKTAIRQ